jgi:hypothetical protein
MRPEETRKILMSAYLDLTREKPSIRAKWIDTTEEIV